MESLILYGLAVAIIFLGLYLRRQKRTALLLPIWVLLGRSLWSIQSLQWIPGLGFQVGMLNIITFFCSPLIFHAGDEPDKVPIRTDGSSDWNLSTAYKLYNNPRMIPSKVPRGEKEPQSTKVELYSFFLCRLAKVIAIYVLQSVVKYTMQAVIGTLSLDEISPPREPLIRRLLSGRTTRRELLLRIFVTTYWLSETVSQLELAHLLLSAIFVVFLRLDKPVEWPPLFGSLLETRSLRRFWGRFWHRLLSPSVAAWAQRAAGQMAYLRVRPALRKTFVAFFVFTVSGLAHGLVNWRLRDHALGADLFFFWVNFWATSLEVVVAKCWAAARPATARKQTKLETRRAEALKKGLGYIWVWGFLIWLTPRLIYPKVYQRAMAEVGAARPS